MKKAVHILILFFISGSIYAQAYPQLRFRKPSTSDNITYRFAHVLSGTDALVSIIGSRNASVDRIDDSSMYAYAWNPTIRISSNASSTDSSYVQFRISFVNAGTNVPTSLTRMAMTVVDLDGSGIGSYREMVKTSLPATPVGILGSLLTTLTNSNELTLISSVLTYSNIDTTIAAAMSQINYNNISSYTLKVGVVGAASRNTVRQFSFYYKGFQSMVFVLPVKMINLQVVSNNEVPVVQWTTTSEQNSRSFEIYRSLDGVNYTLVGEVMAKGNSETVSHYSFEDRALYGQIQSRVFYKIKVLDNDLAFSWSSILHYGQATVSTVSTIKSVYPNPSTGIIHIALSTVSEEEFTIDIVDAFGQVYQQVNSTDYSGMNQIGLDLSHLNNGVYFVRINDANGNSSSSKFIKN